MKANLLFALLCTLGFASAAAFAAKYIDPQTGVKIKYDEDVPQNVLELVAKKLDQLHTIFKNATITWTVQLGPNAMTVRTGIHNFLVQTDLNRVDELNGTVLKVWNDLIVYKDGTHIGTVDRRTFTPIQKFQVPVKGEGEGKWTVAAAGNSLVVQMDWEPTGVALLYTCYAALSVANPANLIGGPYPSDMYTRAGSYYFTVGEDGSIAELIAWDRFFGIFG